MCMCVRICVCGTKDNAPQLPTPQLHTCVDDPASWDYDRSRKPNKGMLNWERNLPMKRKRMYVAHVQYTHACGSAVTLYYTYILGIQITHQLEIFRKNMIEFASKHRDRINKNPYYRAQFHHLCRKVGVDPLASRKGFWSELLGIGDFYYELGIQVIDICAEKQKIYGGLIPLLELTQR
uniref:Vacuolar-sorting protein SNF8 n=1 Tax=Lygus hesperus TaxID=30085 RepID=A0A0A9YAV8_LYGHE